MVFGRIWLIFADFCHRLYLHSTLPFCCVKQFRLLPRGTQIILCSFFKEVFTHVLGLNYIVFFGILAANSLIWKYFQFHDVWILLSVICAVHLSLLRQTVSAFCRAAKNFFNILLSDWLGI